METRVMPTYPQVQRRVLPQWRAGDRYTLDASWKHRRVFGEKYRRGSVTAGKFECTTDVQH